MFLAVNCRSLGGEKLEQFVKDLRKLNLGQELHGNRFGDFEKCCAIGINSIEMWVDLINVRSEARNDLAISMRHMQHFGIFVFFFC